MTSENEDPPTRADILVRALVTASPKAAGSLMVLYEGLRDRRTARLRDALEPIAEVVSGIEDLIGRLNDSDELDVLFVRVIDAASAASLRAHRVALGRVAAQAILDDAAIDRSILVAGALARMDSPHVRALMRLAAAEREAIALGELPESRSERTEGPIVDRMRAATDAEDVAVITMLATLGLVEAADVLGGWEVVRGLTRLGHETVTELLAET